MAQLLMTSRRNLLLGGVAVLAMGLSEAEASRLFHGGTVSTQLPLQSNLAFKLSADSITGLSNGASLTTSSWKDSQNSIAVDTIVGTAPTFQTNVVGGKPSVRFPGSGTNYAAISTPGVLQTAVDSQTYTVLIACKTITGGGLNGLNTVFSASVGNNAFQYLSDTFAAGRFTGAYSLSGPYAGTSFFSMGTISNAAASSGIPLELAMLNGTSFITNASLAPGSGGNQFQLGTFGSSGVYSWNGDIFEILVWNVALTPAQYMQAEMWLRNKYAQPYPWAGVSKMPVFFGDSISAGVGATAISGGTVVVNTPSYLAAQTNLGLTYGQYQDLAIGTLSMNQMTALAPSFINPMPAQTGIPIGVICWEWANQRDSTITAGALMLAALKATPNIQTVFGTSTSASAYDNSPARASYDAAWDAVWAGAKTNMDSYMAIHLDTHIGVDGSYATYSSAGDGLHLVNATYPYLGALMSTGFAALP